MNLRLTGLLVVLAAAAPGAARGQAAVQPADPASPAWVVDRFYASRTFPEKARHITGEYAENYADAPTMGSRLPPSVAVTSRALRVEADRATFATFLRDASHAEDWYTFLRREGGVWKIEAVRTLALPPLHRQLLESLEAQRARGELADSMVLVAETMRLTVRTDSALKAYLLANEPALRAVAERFAAARGLESIGADGGARPAGGAMEAERRALAVGLRALRLTAASRSADGPGCVHLVIGGMLDNEVGFIHAPAGCSPPVPSPGQYIYVEAEAPGWFIYKTT